jgi:hypothetical protein
VFLLPSYNLVVALNTPSTAGLAVHLPAKKEIIGAAKHWLGSSTLISSYRRRTKVLVNANVWHGNENII